MATIKQEFQVKEEAEYVFEIDCTPARNHVFIFAPLEQLSGHLARKLNQIWPTVPKP